MKKMALSREPKRTILYMLPLIFLLINAVYFHQATLRMEAAMLQEKLVEVTSSVDVLAAGIEADTSRPWYDNEQRIIGSVEFLDNLHQVYGGAYKMVNGKLAMITARTFETSVFDPMLYPEFVEAVTNQDAGGLVIGYAPENQAYRELHLYFRWIPLHNLPDERYLVVAGVSTYSIVTRIPAIISIGQWISMAATLALNVWLVAMIAHLGWPEGKRSDRKV